MSNYEQTYRKMKSTKPDRRVNRTRRLLREALLALVMEEGYDAVTIEEITDRADLGRTTFYLHYRDKEDLLLESIETIADDLRIQVDEYIHQTETETNSPNAVLLIFQHAADHASLYRIILRGGAANSVLSRIREMLSDAALEFFEQRFGSLKNSPCYHLADSGGCGCACLCYLNAGDDDLVAGAGHAVFGRGSQFLFQRFVFQRDAGCAGKTG